MGAWQPPDLTTGREGSVRQEECCGCGHNREENVVTAPVLAKPGIQGPPQLNTQKAYWNLVRSLREGRSDRGKS